MQHYDTEDLDASNLLMSIYGFLPYDHPRMVATVAAIYNELCEGGLVYRYRTPDGLAGSEGAFNICTFWLVDNLIGQGRFEEAQVILLRMENYANHLGLFSEEYDAKWRHFIAPYLYEGKDRRFLERQAKDIRIKYLPYDWRLNRT